MNQMIKIEQKGRVLIATLDNPPHALMTGPMVQELDALIRRADRDDGVGAVVFTGSQPERFISHYDTGELLRGGEGSPSLSINQARLSLAVTRALVRIPGMRSLLLKTPVAGVISVQEFHHTLLRMGRSGVIFIAAINGPTAGGGLEFSMACDFRYISDRGELAQPEVLLGFPPGGGGTQRLARLIGRARALELMLKGRGISPDEAYQLGLVTKVVPHDQLLDTAIKEAEQLARRYKPAVAVIKQAVLEGGSLPLEHGLQMEQGAYLALLGMQPVQRALKTYVDYTQRTGILPADDPAARKELEDGTFVDFTNGS
ncbi:MAG: enoyl-CoA hydratase/isomerase family protein [Anaerolineaceae bacterium]|nr:MAG: enoyl-CoA hydratase/isomerase family protein [Anaerolineaceae bacterium]